MKISITETYGELLPESVNKLLRVISINENDVFLDLGSGLGKVVKQIFFQTRVKEAHGIEINADLHAEATQHSLQNSNRTLRFTQGDFLTQPLTDATVVLIASPCFSPSILHALGKRINDTSTIHTVLSLRPIATLTRLQFKKIIRVECSWDTALCYVYKI
jgi:16S rRNA A1518/A1519 N6-dimethyltransferase RsmA/KsgA/DIM1 with predicted DNA glycosylase/AP lyase activity